MRPYLVLFLVSSSHFLFVDQASARALCVKLCQRLWQIHPVCALSLTLYRRPDYIFSSQERRLMQLVGVKLNLACCCADTAGCRVAFLRIRLWPPMGLLLGETSVRP